MHMDKSFVAMIAGAVHGALETIHTLSERDELMPIGRARAEVLLFVMVSVQDTTCDALSLDDDADGEGEDTDDDCGGGRGTPAAFDELNSDKLEILVAWVEASLAVMDFVTSTIASGHTPPEILAQYLQMWNSLPYFVDALVHFGKIRCYDNMYACIMYCALFTCVLILC